MVKLAILGVILNAELAKNKKPKKKKNQQNKMRAQLPRDVAQVPLKECCVQVPLGRLRNSNDSLF